MIKFLKNVRIAKDELNQPNKTNLICKFVERQNKEITIIENKEDLHRIRMCHNKLLGAKEIETHDLHFSFLDFFQNKCMYVSKIKCTCNKTRPRNVSKLPTASLDRENPSKNKELTKLKYSDKKESDSLPKIT
jgi:hypothetical protein